MTKFKASGFASPAEDFIEPQLDLNRYLIKHPSSTFFMRVASNRYRHLGVFKQDLLLIDRLRVPSSKKLIVAIVDGELRLLRLGDGPLINSQTEFWGLVTYLIRKL